MIKSFTKSKEFMSLFTLKLLADTLYAIVEKSQSQNNEAPLEEAIGETLEESTTKEYSSLLEVIQPGKTNSESTRDLNEKEGNKGETAVTPCRAETTAILEEESVRSNMSSNTVRLTSEDGKDSTPNKAAAMTKMTNDEKLLQTENSCAGISFFEGSDEEKNVTKSIIQEKIDSNTNKKIFFSSDSDVNDSSTSEFEETATSRRKKNIIKEGMAKIKNAKGNIVEPDMDESEGLKKLLKMTNIPETRVKSATDEDEKEVKEEKGKEISKWKKENIVEEKETLMNYLNLSEKAHCDVASNPESECESETSNKFLTEFNDEMKNTFLLSSTESELSEGSMCERSKKFREMKNEKKKVLSRLRNKQDDLFKYRISISEDDSKTEDQSSGRLSPLEHFSSGGSDSGSCKKSKLRRKYSRMKNMITLTESSDSSSSDIEQIPVIKSEDSPTKGRRNIKKIYKKKSLQVETKQALKMETERKKRLSERKKVFQKFFSNTSRLILDFDPKTKKELVVVEENLSNKLKPHQREGVKFMWENCFESLERIKEDPGSGCILAHCMGLGKTLQVISLVHTILTHETKVSSVMILCPLNTLKNWLHEFKIWLTDTKKPISVCDLVPCKTKHSKIAKIKLWKRKGGVLVLSYEMLRSLLGKENNTKTFSHAFLDPGPDLVVCDEGHVLKNENSALYSCISQIKTLRRIILTGTPLQNNLLEYYCMVQFVKQNILGTRKEFMNRFVNPINNGQFEDSTQLDVRIMKRRSHVLHTMVDGFVQRFGYYVLTPFLPEKQEYVISITLTPTQAKLYRLFIEGETDVRCRSEGLFNDFSWLQKVWTHPFVMLQYAKKNELEDEKADKTMNKPERMKEHWGRFVKESEYEDIRSSGKLVLLFSILKKCYEVGDKILVFSQYLSTLNMIEHFLQKTSQSYFLAGGSSSSGDTWVLGEDYFRMDGSTSVDNRHMYCWKFNNKQNKRSRLFLISTRAGGLGINLVGANRVVIFDASWNPSQDVQSIFRVYRFGQEKPCYIYRFLAEATMEEKVYKRQVNKLSLAHRILDEHQIERHYTMGNLQELYRYEPIHRGNWEVPKVPKDKLFAEILVCNKDIIVGYHEHDSLLENKEEEELTEEERQAAWEEFEKERQAPELLNGHPVINVEGLKTVPVYTQSFDSTLSKQRVFNQSSNQLCKIVEVRTLQGQSEAMKRLSDVDTGRLVEIGRSYGLIPYEGEIAHNYRVRLKKFMKAFFMWNSTNQISSALN